MAGFAGAKTPCAGRESSRNVARSAAISAAGWPRSVESIFLYSRRSGVNRRLRAARCFAAALITGDDDDRAWDLVLRGVHPDVVEIDPPATQIRIEDAQAVVDEVSRSPIEGERKVGRWAARHGVAVADWPTEPVDPFFNANRPEDVVEAERLHALLGGA